MIVPHRRTATLLLLGLVALTAQTLWAQAVPPLENLLPETTGGAVIVTNVDALEKQFDKTQIGQLINDPVMEPFRKDLRRQFDKQFSRFQTRLGITIDDLRPVPSGEVALAKIQPKADVAVLAIVADVAGHHDKADAMLAKVIATQTKQGGKRKDVKVGPATIVHLLVPEQKNEAARVGPAPAAAPAKVEMNTAAYCRHNDLLVSADDLDVIQAIVKHYVALPAKAAAEKPAAKDDKPGEATAEKPAAKQGNQEAPKAEKPADAKPAEGDKAETDKPAAEAKPAEEPKPAVTRKPLDALKPGAVAAAEPPKAPADTLGAHEGFINVMRRCAKDAGDVRPQLRWFIHPVTFAELSHTTTAPERRRKGKSIAEMMRNQGFAALQGVGGYVDFIADGGLEWVHRSAVYAPPPYKKSMQMLVFPNGGDFTPQPWVPRDIATYTTFYCDINNAFKHFGSLFDEYMNQDKAWEGVLQGLRDQPDGPRIDLEKEVVAFLKQRVTMITDCQLPITTQSERLFFAIECSDDAKLAKGIDKLFKDDDRMQRRQYKQRAIWEMVEKEDEAPVAPRIVIPGQPAPPAPPPGGNQPLLPHAAITVAHGHLLCASHYDFLIKMLDSMDKQPDPLHKDVTYRLVDSMVSKMQFAAKSAQHFSLTDEEFQTTYELVRMNKMPQSETILARLLNRMSDAGKQGQQRQGKIDGSKLPPYDVVRRNLGPAGAALISEKDGWFLKGFTLTK